MVGVALRGEGTFVVDLSKRMEGGGSTKSSRGREHFLYCRGPQVEQKAQRAQEVTEATAGFATGYKD